MPHLVPIRFAIMARCRDAVKRPAKSRFRVPAALTSQRNKSRAHCAIHGNPSHCRCRPRSTACRVLHAVRPGSRTTLCGLAARPARGRAGRRAAPSQTDRRRSDEQQSRSRVSGPGPGRGAEDRLSADGRSERSQDRPWRDPEGGQHEHLRLRPAHGARPDHGAGRSGARPRDHRRGDRAGQRRGDAQDRRHRHGAVQRGLRALPDVPRTEHGRVPERQSGARRRRLWLCRHGRLDRRPGRIRAGALCRLQPDQVPGSRPGDGEDPRPDLPVRHPAHRLSRRRHGRREAGLDRLYRRRGPGGDGGGRLGAPARRGGDDRRRHERRASSRTHARSVSKPSTCPRTRRSASRSRRSSAAPRSIARWTAWASRRTATARPAMPRRHPPRC